MQAEVVTAEAEVRPFRVIGYLPEYRFRKFTPEHATGLTDLILFAAEPNADGTIELGRVKQAPWEQLAPLQQQGLRVFLCLGGWGRSSHFSTVVQTATTRQALVKNIVEQLKSLNLDGLDLDWEYPKTEAELEGYATLLEELQTAFKPESLELSLTIAPWKSVPKRGFEAADWIQLMCYDYGQRHSTREHAEKDVQTFLDLEVPSRKLVLGLPFYGRDIDDRSRVLSYFELQRRYQPDTADDVADNIFFNGPETIRYKTRLAMNRQLGGVMIWEIGLDARDSTSLTQAIQQELRTLPAPKVLPSRPWTTPVRRLPKRNVIPAELENGSPEQPATKVLQTAQ